MKTQYIRIKVKFVTGFITITGGHRVGIVGTVIQENKKITNINNISSLNVRISREILGVSNKLLKYVFNHKQKNIYNTLIISPPGVRKNYNIERFNKKYK